MNELHYEVKGVMIAREPEKTVEMVWKVIDYFTGSETVIVYLNRFNNRNGFSKRQAKNDCFKKIKKVQVKRFLPEEGH